MSAARTIAPNSPADVGFVGKVDAACKRLSAEATLRGEPNEPERKGLKWDWTDPKTWERSE